VETLCLVWWRPRATIIGVPLTGSGTTTQGRSKTWVTTSASMMSAGTGRGRQVPDGDPVGGDRRLGQEAENPRDLEAPQLLQGRAVGDLEIEVADDVGVGRGPQGQLVTE
jgi:hypothetical protein